MLGEGHFSKPWRKEGCTSLRKQPFLHKVPHWTRPLGGEVGSVANTPVLREVRLYTPRTVRRGTSPSPGLHSLEVRVGSPIGLC